MSKIFGIIALVLVALFWQKCVSLYQYDQATAVRAAETRNAKHSCDWSLESEAKLEEAHHYRYIDIDNLVDKYSGC